MNDTEASVNRMEERLKLWDAKLDVLMARAEAADAQAKIEHLKCSALTPPPTPGPST